MQKFAALVATLALIVFWLMFSVVLLAFIASTGLIVFGYLWWKTRALRRQMRQMREQDGNDAEFRSDAVEGEIIEGEVIRKVVSIEEIRR